MAQLTAKQEKFVQELMKAKSPKGKGYTDAYRKSYNCKNMKDTTVNRKAKALWDLDKIRARYEELNKRHQDKAIMTKDELLRGLKKAFKMALGIEAKPYIIKAIVEGEEEVTENMKINSVDLKAISPIAHQISELEGWKKNNDNNDDSIMALANAISGLK